MTDAAQIAGWRFVMDRGDLNPASEEPDDVYAATSQFVRIRLDAHG